MRKILLIPCLILSLMSACATTSPENNSFCKLAHPIYFDKSDVVSERTKEEVLSQFDTGYKLCGWEKI